MIALSIVLLATLAGCGGGSHEPPDCNGGAQDYISLCTEEQGASNAEANGRSMYESCAAYELGNNAEQEDRSFDWVDCMAEAQTCSDASDCRDAFDP